MQQTRQMTCTAQPAVCIRRGNCEVVGGNLRARCKTVARCKRSSTESMHRSISEELKPAARTISAVISPSDAAHTLQDVQTAATQDVLERLQRVKERGLELWSAYEAQLAERPVRTKALTSMVGLALGDLIAQASTGAFDPMRTVRMAAFGAALHGPVGHIWYQFLDAKVMPKNPTAPEAIVGKMVLDQAVFAPIFTALFYAVLTTMEGRPEAIPEVLSSRLIPTVFAGYALWPLAHLVSFKFVPNEYRLLYINAVNLIWTVHLSKLASAPIAIDSPLPVTPDPTTFTYPTIPVSSNGGDMIFMTPGATTVNTI